MMGDIRVMRENQDPRGEYTSPKWGRRSHIGIGP